MAQTPSTLRPFNGRPGDIRALQQVMSANGAITIKHGHVLVTKAGVCAMTLAAPVAGVDNGCVLVIDSQTANAHTLTLSGGLRGVGASADVGTFGGAIGDGVTLYAYNGAWYPVPSSNQNVTFA